MLDTEQVLKKHPRFDVIFHSIVNMVCLVSVGREMDMKLSLGHIMERFIC